MKRAQFNAVLAVVAVGLGVAVFFAQEKEEKGPPLTALGSNGVSRIAIEHPNAAPIRLEKAGERWRMTTPVPAEVDDVEINGVLALAELPTQQRIELAQVEPKALELEPPQYRVTLNDTLLEFGGIEPLKYWRYIRTAAAVFLVDDPPSAALDRDYADLVAKNPVPQGAELLRLQLPGLALAQGDADAAAVFAAWKSAKSMWNELATDARNPKGDAVTLTLKDRTLKFVVVERDPQFKLYAPSLGIRYVLPKTLVSELLERPKAKK